MYQVEAAAALRRTVLALRGRRFWPHVSRNVVALGFTSLLTDVSSEMISTVLPIYLVLYLGLTPLQFGLVDGVYHGFTPSCGWPGASPRIARGATRKWPPSATGPPRCASSACWERAAPGR